MSMDMNIESHVDPAGGNPSAVCPCCGRHCPADALHCGRGENYFAQLKDPAAGGKVSRENPEGSGTEETLHGGAGRDHREGRPGGFEGNHDRAQGPEDGRNRGRDGEGRPHHGGGEGRPHHGGGEGHPHHRHGEGKPHHGDGEGRPHRGGGEGRPYHGDGEGHPHRGDGEGRPYHGDGEGHPHRGDGEDRVYRGEGRRPFGDVRSDSPHKDADAAGPDRQDRDNSGEGTEQA